MQNVLNYDKSFDLEFNCIWLECRNELEHLLVLSLQCTLCTIAVLCTIPAM